MTFVSAHFGPVAVNESSTIEFPEGLPGFEECRRFLPLQNGPSDGLIFLQSLERAELCFLAVTMQSVRPDYELCVTADDLELLGLPADRQPQIGKDVVALGIISLEEGEDPTVNLCAPLVIQMESRRAVQAIRPDGTYRCREPLVAQAEAVCS